MKDIKTKESYKGIKTHDRRIHLTDKMKEAMVRSKDRAENLSDDGQVTPEEYAGDQVKYAADDLTDRTAHGIKRTADNTWDLGKRGIRRIKERRAERKATEDAVKTAERTAKMTVRTSEKAAEATAKTAERTVKTTQETSRVAIKTAEASAKVAAETAKKTAEASAKAAKVAAEATQKAAVAAYKAAVAFGKAVVAACKAIAAGVSKLVAAIAAGGWVAVVVLIAVCLIAGILMACFGWLLPKYDTGAGGVSIDGAVSYVKSDYDAKIEAIKNAQYYDRLEIEGEPKWKDIIAVFMVKYVGEVDLSQGVSMDNGQRNKLLDTFWAMTTFSHSVETQREGKEDKKILKITIWPKDADDMKKQYKFSNSQKKQLDELLSEKNADLWNGILDIIRSS